MKWQSKVEHYVNLGALGEWMDEQGLQKGPIKSLERLAGGTQNIILSFERGDRRFVLRRPPSSPRPESNETMRREARILSALGATNVPHPKLIASCSSEEVLGVAFYLMEPVDGFTATVNLPPLHAGSSEIRRQMGVALVDGAAALARVDHVAVGLGDFGKPENYLDRQVRRWRAQLDGYSSHAGWPGRQGLPAIDAISDYLTSQIPASFLPGIMHGDYSIGNVMYRHDGPELAAIIDWELATIGDPLIDLGWIIATWPGDPAGDLDVLIVRPWDGFPTASQLIERYAEQSERSLEAIDWYIVLACFKLAIILEGTFARACAGRDPMDTGRKLHGTACKLLDRAQRRIR